MLKLGLMGYGAIGKDVIHAMAAGELPGLACPAVLVRRARQEPEAPPLVADAEAFFAHPYDVVLEVAGHQAIRNHGARVLEQGADLLVTSVGAFTDPALFDRIMDAARANGRRVIVPSAGVGALDYLSAAAQGGLDEVVMTVRKDAASWKGTHAETLCDLDRLTEPKVIYDGPARGGAAAYPQNVNISAAVSLAGLGLDRTRLILYADPERGPHIVQVEARGRFGRFLFRSEGVPSTENRKTGIIVAMAVIKTLRQLTSTLVVGG
ncbi:MAG: aspartate dehydrogenase [Deltaproteobacteria bacterium]|nr:aspartate dehydrogenase [Deltaproteobacteria bacterium]